MSVSGFYHQFKTLTAMSPLQFQKQLRLQEARRLLYVGMTRAKDRLVLTRAERRKDLPTGGYRFLTEMGFTPGPPG